MTIKMYKTAFYSLLVVLIALTIFFVMNGSFALNNENIYTRDELSSMVNVNNLDINTLNNVISNSKTFNIYVNNTLVNNLSSSIDYHLDSYTCLVNNVSYNEDSDLLKWENNTLILNNNIKEKINCTIYFFTSSYYNKTLAQKIYEDNTKVASRTNFATVFEETTTGNIYYTSTNTENVCSSTNALTYVSGSGANSICKTYYFAGNTTNNFVSFGGYLWQIVRINEDESVRLIYYKKIEPTNQFTGLMGYSSAGVPFGFGNHNRNSNLGFFTTIEGDENYTITTTNTSRSPIGISILMWFINDAVLSYDKDYLSKTAIYCNDRSISSGLGYGTNETYYKGYERLVTNKTPQYKCPLANDRFTVSATSANGLANYGNGRLSYGVALISADEMAYIGKVNGMNSSDFLINSYTTYSSWFTMTPHSYKSFPALFKSTSSGTGKAMLTGTSAESTIGVRPVLSLKSCVKYTKGNGTINNPYEVIIDNACKTAIN